MNEPRSDLIDLARVSELTAERDVERARREAVEAKVRECADDFAALPTSYWTGVTIANTFRAALAAAVFHWKPQPRRSRNE